MYRRMTMMKQTIAVLLALFCLTLCLAALAEAPQVFTAAPEVQQVTGLGENTNTAAEGYIRKVFGLPDLAPVSRAPKRGTLLDPDSPEKRLYDALEEKIQLVAKGQLESTAFEIPMSELFDQLSYTSKELGLGASGITEDNLNLFEAKFTVNTSSVVKALMNDMPYELFWFDKTAGYNYGSSGYSYSSTRAFFAENAKYYVTMLVAQEYAVSGTEEPTTFDSSFVEQTQMAASNAEQIVQAYAPLSDMSKLTTYKDRICDLTSYNSDAAENDPPYGNPWQVVWVFDGDTSTNVVCEGYAKAFQWLCDMSSFQTAVSSSIVTGSMGGGTGAGPHMWNLVTMGNGKNYLVDVTNCDEGTVGAPDHLFMKGYTRYEIQDNNTVYYYDIDEYNYSTYVYGIETTSLYSADELDPSADDFGTEDVPDAFVAPLHEVTWTVIPENPTTDTGVNVEFDKEYQEIDYAVSDSNGFITSGELYSTDTISLNGLSAGNFIIDITCFDEGVPLPPLPP